MILSVGNATKICNPIVKAITVYVINLPFRPDAVNVSPRNTVSFVFLAVDLDAPITNSIRSACNETNFYS